VYNTAHLNGVVLDETQAQIYLVVNLTTLSVAYIKQHQIVFELLIKSLGSVWNEGRMAQFELLSRGNCQ
jgi:hypothetical protein